MRRQGLLSTTGLFLLVLIIGLTLHEWEGAMPLRDTPPTEGPSLVLEQVDARNFNQQGALRYQLDAANLTRMHLQPVTDMTAPHLTVHGTAEVWSIQAEQGRVSGDNSDIVLRQAVRARRLGEPVLALDTETLRYRPADGEISSPGRVDIRHPGGRTRAGAMRANLADGILQLEQQVESRYEGTSPAS